MYNYYCYAGSHIRRVNTHNVSFRRVSPPFNSIHNVLWHICSYLRGSRFYEYQILRDNKVLSTAQLCPKLPIFAFINNRGVAHRTLHDNKRGTWKRFLSAFIAIYY